MTDPTALETAHTPTPWYTLDEGTSVMSVPGGAVVRVERCGLTFVPGVTVEPIGHKHYGYARLVAAPDDVVESAESAQRRRPEAGRHTDPSTAASRPVSELHLRPPTAQGVGPAAPITTDSPGFRNCADALVDKLAAAQALASPPPTSRGPTIAAKLRHGEHFEVLGQTFRVDAGPDGRIILVALDPGQS